MSITSFARRKVLTSFIAAFTAAAGFASSSCASPRLPTGGYPLRSSAGGYELQVFLDGAQAQTYEQDGETYVLGQLGARYTLRVVNHTGRRIEAVASVDGRDAIDGRSADVRTKRGYLVPAWGSVDIDGWRLSRAEVAAFRFSSVADSYAARTGTAREVGVIGVAVFPERYVPPPRPVYVPPPHYNYQSPRGYEGGDDASDQGARYSSGGEAAAKSAQPSASSAEAAPAPASPAPSRPPSRPASSPPLPSPSLSPSPAVSGSPSRRESLAEAAPSPRRRPGLGTEFGEAVNSAVQEVSFARANSMHPAVILGVRYNDRDGLVALGINVDGCCTGDDDLAWRQTATPFPTGDRRYAAPPTGWRQGCCLR